MQTCVSFVWQNYSILDIDKHGTHAAQIMLLRLVGWLEMIRQSVRLDKNFSTGFGKFLPNRTEATHAYQEQLSKIHTCICFIPQKRSSLKLKQSSEDLHIRVIYNPSAPTKASADVLLQAPGVICHKGSEEEWKPLKYILTLCSILLVVKHWNEVCMDQGLDNCMDW